MSEPNGPVIPTPVQKLDDAAHRADATIHEVLEYLKEKVEWLLSEVGPHLDPTDNPNKVADSTEEPQP